MLCIRSIQMIVIAAAVLAFANSRSALAVLVAELNFQSLDTVPDPDQTPFTNNKAGSSDTAEISDGTAADVSINTGSTGFGPLFHPAIRSGFLDAPSRFSGGVESINTTGTNGFMNNYIDTSSGGMGEGSLFVVFNPDFSGQPTTRMTLFSHRIQTSSQVWLLHNSTSGPFFRMGPDSSVNDLFLSSFQWDTTKTYMVAASWRDTPLGGSQFDREMNIYVREITATMPAAVADSLIANNITVSGIGFQEMHVGRRSNSDTEGADGQILLFRMYDTFFSESDFDVAYQQLFVPEPSSGILLGLGLFLSRGLCRRRVLSKQRCRASA